MCTSYGLVPRPILSSVAHGKKSKLLKITCPHHTTLKSLHPRHHAHDEVYQVFFNCLKRLRGAWVQARTYRLQRRRGHVTQIVYTAKFKSERKTLLHLVTTAALVVYSVTVYSTDLNFARYKVTCPLLLWSL